MNDPIITIEKRSDDYLAFLNGDRRLWGCGRTIMEAIGDMVMSHNRRMGIAIQYPERPEEPDPGTDVPPTTP